ncbi:MAG: class I SAM-dependent methyltransferase [Deltaproteobacteria bacterium]|nr:class I SAM-dependent methyltransferase [Deltaproteobacteria bacterium]
MPRNIRLEDAYSKVRRNLGRRVNSIKEFRIPSTDVILEIGCGDGLNLKVFYSIGYRNILGLDLSFFLLRHVSPETPSFCATAFSLPVKSESIDTVYMDSVFCDLTDFHKPVNEVYRVLKPGGLFCSCEPRRSFVRSAFDLLTFSFLSNIVNFFKYRRQEYEEDWELLQEWLNSTGKFRAYLQELNFDEVFFKKGLLGFWLKARKPYS